MYCFCIVTVSIKIHVSYRLNAACHIATGSLKMYELRSLTLLPSFSISSSNTLRTSSGNLADSSFFLVSQNPHSGTREDLATHCWHFMFRHAKSRDHATIGCGNIFRLRKDNGLNPNEIVEFISLNYLNYHFLAWWLRKYFNWCFRKL